MATEGGSTEYRKFLVLTDHVMMCAQEQPLGLAAHIRVLIDWQPNRTELLRRVQFERPATIMGSWKDRKAAADPPLPNPTDETCPRGPRFVVR